MPHTKIPLTPAEKLGRFLASIAAVSIAFTLGVKSAGELHTVSPMKAVGEAVRGDYSGDGVLAIDDAIIALELSMHQRDVTDDDLAIDWNNDGNVTADDALGILQTLSR
jgi:hypothetical protein